MVCGEPRQPGLAASVHESGSSRPGQRPQRSDRSLQRDSHGALGDGCGVELMADGGWFHCHRIRLRNWVCVVVRYDPLIIDHLA